MDNIFNYIRQQRHSYENETIPIFEGMDFSQSDTINQINHYWMDSYVQQADASDDVIGDYPFDNISKFRVLLEARATDFDTKHVDIEPKNGSREARVSAMIATKALRQHMRDINFGKFVNDVCYTRPKYGGVLSTEIGDEMHVMPWENLVTDQSDIMGGIRIYRHYMKPSDMAKKKDVWNNVEDAMMTADDMREKGIESSRDAKTQGDVIEVFEIQGDIKKCMFEYAVALMNGDEYEYNPDDEYEYVEARIHLCGAEWNEEKTDDKGEKYNIENGIVLEATEMETTQNYIARNSIVGRGLGEGVIESLFEHQKWHNFSKTEEMRMIAIAGKKVYVTDDPDVLSNIFDDGVDHGTVLRVGEGKNITALNQIPTGVPVYQNIRAELDESANRVTSSFGAKIGEEAKSGTPFRSQYLQNVEASSQFEQYREEMGIGFFTPIIRDRLLPKALNKASEADEIFDTFSPQELQLIDEVIIEKTILAEVVEKSLNREVMTPEQVEELRARTQQQLNKRGNKRTLKGIKDFIQNAGGKVVIRTTDESRNKAVFFESMANALQLLAPEDPRRNAIIDRIMDSIGISREELEIYAEQSQSNPRPKLENEQLLRANQVGADLAQA